jgi:hypothetical protein
VDDLDRQHQHERLTTMDTTARMRYAAVAGVIAAACIASCGSAASLASGTRPLPSPTESAGVSGTTHTGHPHPSRHGGAAQYFYSGAIVRHCVVGHAVLTVFERSTPIHICIRQGGVLQLRLSPAGTGERWIVPTVDGRTVLVSGFHRIGQGATLVITAERRGRVRLNSGVVAEEGSSRGWAAEVRVP